MLPFLSLSGFFLSGLLLYFNAREYPSSIFLGFFFLLTSLYGFLQHVLLYSGVVWLVSIFFLHFTFLVYLIGPMLYWYIRGVLTDDPRLRKRDWWHFAPMVIILVISFPYFLEPWSYKMEVAAKIVEDSRYLGHFIASPAYRLVAPQYILMSRPLFPMLYTLWCIAEVIRYEWRKEKTGVLRRQHFMIRWLAVLLICSLLLASSQFLILVETAIWDDPRLYFTLNGLLVLSGTGLVGLMVSPFFFPQILYGLPRMRLEPSKQDAEKEKSRHSRFEAEYLDSIGRKVDTCMAEFQPFLQPEFSMAHLTVLIEVPVHHLAYFFREEKKQSFTEYRNFWRVQYAKELIRQGRARELTLEAIGLLCGFSSRNTFLTAFKKAEGISPSEYAAQVAA